MELEYSDKNRRRSKVYIAVGIIVALLVAVTVFIALRASGLTATRASRCARLSSPLSRFPVTRRSRRTTS